MIEYRGTLTLESLDHIKTLLTEDEIAYISKAAREIIGVEKFDNLASRLLAEEMFIKGCLLQYMGRV